MPWKLTQVTAWKICRVLFRVCARFRFAGPPRLFFGPPQRKAVDVRLRLD